MDYSHDLPVLLDSLLASQELDPQQVDAAWNAIQRIAQGDPEQLDDLLAATVSLRPIVQSVQTSQRLLFDRLLEVLHTQALQRPSEDTGWFEPVLIEQIGDWYQHLGTQHSTRAYLLALLAREGSRESLERIAELVVDDPPIDQLGIDIVFATLFQRHSNNTPCLFPRLWEALSNPIAAPAVLDLANYLYRESIGEDHLATDILPRLRNLLQSLVAELSRVESGKGVDDTERLSEQVNASISLGVSICDCIALTQYQEALPEVVQALELGHRRLRCEAAWALARLSDERGTEALVELADEPVARLRVLSYSEELGILDQIPKELQTDVAHAEAELALWLAQPQQMGVAPTRFELLDRRSLAWPGFEAPVESYLFRFEYDFGRGRYENVGIVGPTTAAVTADLLDLPPLDLYAFFAGLSATHEDIQEKRIAELTADYDAEIARLVRRLKDEGLDDIEPQLLGLFFGDRVLVAQAKRLGQPGLAVNDALDVSWFPDQQKERPLAESDLFALYKGRKLLRAFNPDEPEQNSQTPPSPQNPDSET